MNLFRIMQSIRGWAQAGKIDFPGAVKYLTDLGVKMDGIVHQALKNVFKEGKARDPEFGNVVEKLQIDDAGIPFNPKTLKSTAEKRVPTEGDRLYLKKTGLDEGKVDEGIESIRGTSEADKDIAFIQEGIDDLNRAEREADLVSQKEGIENLFDEKLPNVKMGSKMNYEKIADLEGIDVELIRGKNWDEIRAIIAAVRDKADGGRVGFVDGGWADDLTGQGLALYNSMTAGGHSDEAIQDTLTELGYWGGSPTGVQTITNTQPIIIPGGDARDGPPPGPTFRRSDNLNPTGIYGADYYGEGPGFIESILGIPAALVNAYTKVSPIINFAKNIFKPRVEEYVTQPTVDAIEKADEERKAKAKAERDAFLAAQQRTNIAQQLGGPDGTSGGKYAGGDAFASANPYGGKGTRDDMGADTFYKKGGLATMFTRRR